MREKQVQIDQLDRKREIPNKSKEEKIPEGERKREIPNERQIHQ